VTDGCDTSRRTTQTGPARTQEGQTRALLQQTALRLFREQGYAETSIEEIAEAAEVSTTTVFRYFPTKADLVIYDDLDARLIEVVRAQPAELTVLQVCAMRCGPCSAG